MGLKIQKINMISINETHDFQLRSWLDCANSSQTDFPIQNLPFAVFRRKNAHETWRGCVGIGDFVLDLTALNQVAAFSSDIQKILAFTSQSYLNDFMDLGAKAWSDLRLILSRGLRSDALENQQKIWRSCLIHQTEIEFKLPAQIGNYTDFYTSIHHASNVGRLFRPDNPLLPNYKWLPIAYHARASSIGISGQNVKRPKGQIMRSGAHSPVLSLSERMDYELELGVFIGKGNPLGKSIALGEVDQHIFALCLLNDWSARDLQSWEYQPLGPFLAKNFASTISPWMITLEALIPFRTNWTRDKNDPQPLDYLDSDQHRLTGAIDIQLQVEIETEQMRQNNEKSVRLSQSNFRDTYWTIAQMIAHHTINGCNLQSGDLLGTGTQSGALPNEAGSLLELSCGGKTPVVLPNGEKRTFLENGDCVIFKAFCEKPNAARIGFGEVRAMLLANES